MILELSSVILCTCIEKVESNCLPFHLDIAYGTQSGSTTLYVQLVAISQANIQVALEILKMKCFLAKTLLISFGNSSILSHVVNVIRNVFKHYS